MLPSAGKDQSSQGDNFESLGEEDKLVFALIDKYEDVIKALTNRNNQYRENLEECSNTLCEVVSENSRLISDLKLTLENQIFSLESEAGLPANAFDRNFNQQLLQTATEEKEQVLQAWQLALREIERLEQRLQQHNNHRKPNVSQIQHHTLQVKDEYSKIVSGLNETVLGLKEEIRKTRIDLVQKTSQVNDLETLLESVKEQLIAREKTAAEMVLRSTKQREQIAHLQDEMSAVKIKYAEALRESVESKENNKILQEQLNIIVKKNSSLTTREHELVQQMKESLQMAEDAMLEKDKAQMKIHYHQNEITRLKDALAQLVDEAGLRTKKEVEVVHKAYSLKLSRLETHAKNLEVKNVDLQLGMERAVREKNTLDLHLQKLHEEIKGSDYQQSYQELYNRLVKTERNFSEVVGELDSTKTKLKLTEENQKKMCNRWQVEKNQLFEKITWLEKDCEAHLESKVNLTYQVENLHSTVQELNHQVENYRQRMEQEASYVESEKAVEEAKWTAKLTRVEEYYQKKGDELRQLLKAQQKLGLQWKSEMKLASQMWESKMSDTQIELTQYKQRNMELSELVHKQTKKIQEKVASR